VGHQLRTVKFVSSKGNQERREDASGGWGDLDQLDGRSSRRGLGERYGKLKG